MLSLLSAETEEATRTLFMAPVWFGVVGLLGFAGLLAVTYAFRNIGKNH
jgi:hypothetical protein